MAAISYSLVLDGNANVRVASAGRFAVYACSSHYQFQDNVHNACILWDPQPYIWIVWLLIFWAGAICLVVGLVIRCGPACWWVCEDTPGRPLLVSVHTARPRVVWQGSRTTLARGLTVLVAPPLQAPTAAAGRGTGRRGGRRGPGPRARALA